MHVLITGAAGMLGRKLAERLMRDAALGEARISRLTLADTGDAAWPEAPFAVDALVCDLTGRETASHLVADRPDVIFHLAAVVSGEAETDPDKGYRVNVEGFRSLLGAIAAHGRPYCPRVVFSSSIAVFGPPFPSVIGDDHRLAPQTSYGAQKAMVELLLADSSRRGNIDGIAIRLPTICVRPGRPNRAASGFFSSIIREPLNGHEAHLPVPDDTRHWFASPRSGTGFLIHAATLEGGSLTGRRCLTMPGVSATVADEIAALRSVAGDAAVELIRREPDKTIARIVAGWPQRFEPRHALELGFQAEQSFEEIVGVYLADDLNTGSLAGAA